MSDKKWRNCHNLNMIKQSNKKKSSDIDKLARFIVNAIMKTDTPISPIREKNRAARNLEFQSRPKEAQSVAESQSAKVRGKMALKASMERCSKSGSKTDWLK